MIIGIDARFFGPKTKGLGRYTQKLIEGLEHIDSKNEYVIFLRKLDFDSYQPRNPNFKKVVFDCPWYSFSEQIFFPLTISKHKIDLMHFPHFNAPIFYFGPFVATIHDLILMRFGTRRASIFGAFRYFIKKIGYKIAIWSIIARAKKIITVSEYVKKDILSHFNVNEQKISVIYEGRPEADLSLPKEKNENNFFKKLGVKNSYWLYVGNAYPHKNLKNLLLSYKILSEKYKCDSQLLLVGEEDYFYQKLKQESFKIFGAENKNVVFAGFVADEDLAVLYKNACVYVFPSFYEGFGLPPLEAMSFGLPVACANATCLPEILGGAAIYFNPEKPQDMAEKINCVLADKNLRKNLIDKGFQQIKKYSWEEMARKTLKMYL